MKVITMTIILSILLIISIIDLKTQTIPDQLNALLFVLGIWSSFALQGITLMERFLGIFVVSIPLIVVAFLFSGGIGGGDIKLMASSGVFLGVSGNIAAAFIGLFLSGIYGIVLLLTRRASRKDYFSLGPFLCLGIAAIFLKINLL